MTEEERQNTKYFITCLLILHRDAASLRFMQRNLLYLPKFIQNLPFVRAIEKGNSPDALDQASDFLVSDLMELAENEYNNGLPENVQ